ncbi:unnamed protein product [Angiostrongylus costaricensis]|uniref:Uncharacterized protein n=1 Tax=Angiostrongylus costaricensis TaxID=334426 RepID=A0A0R3PMN7_ANGCS|nr:unnamed protein product [Angiostrongylus costaricensis]
MGGKRGRPVNDQQDRVRTHLFFSKQTVRQHQKRKRRAHNRLHQVTHKKDEIIQTGELDPLEWTGNQRVLHFGPMAQRDPYFYYYPKGWDVLYPAYFGFFPYRTKKFRGSSSIVCICAFGVFMILGGSLMVCMGFFLMHDSPFWTWTTDRRHRPPPIQIAGPLLFGSGTVLVLGFFKMYLHHTKRHDEPARITTITTTQYLPAVFEKDPYHPLPPPAYPVLENKYAHSSIVRPHDEMKLYPPVIPGCSTLSLHRKSPSSIFVASPYNTLRATSVGRYDFIYTVILSSTVSRKTSVESGVYKRSKSAGPLYRTSSAHSSTRARYRENSQI